MTYTFSTFYFCLISSCKHELIKFVFQTKFLNYDNYILIYRCLNTQLLYLVALWYDINRSVHLNVIMIFYAINQRLFSLVLLTSSTGSYKTCRIYLVGVLIRLKRYGNMLHRLPFLIEISHLFNWDQKYTDIMRPLRSVLFLSLGGNEWIPILT